MSYFPPKLRSKTLSLSSIHVQLWSSWWQQRRPIEESPSLPLGMNTWSKAWSRSTTCWSKRRLQLVSISKKTTKKTLRVLNVSQALYFGLIHAQTSFTGKLYGLLKNFCAEQRSDGFHLDLFEFIKKSVRCSRSLLWGQKNVHICFLNLH